MSTGPTVSQDRVDAASGLRPLGGRPPGRLRTAFLVVAYLVIVLIWGTTWYGMKVSVDGFPPLTAAGLRFTIAFPLLLLAVAVVPGWRLLPPPGSRWLVPVLTLTYIAVPYGLINFGEQRTASGLAALIFASVTVLLVLMSVLLGTVRVRASQWCAIALGLGLLGVVVTQAGGGLEAHGPWGPLAIFGAATLHALSYALIARYGRAASVISLEVLPIGIGGLLLLAAGLLTENPRLSDASERSWWAVIYLAVVASVVGFALYFYLLQQVSPVLLSFVFIFFPVVALGVSAWLEDVRINRTMVLASVGALIAFAASGRRGADPEAERVNPARSGGPGLPAGLDATALAAICSQALAAFPQECCGFVTAAGVRPAANVADTARAPDGSSWPRTSADGYVLSAGDVRWLTDSLDSDLPTTVLYHSHPNGRAYFSAEDTAYALYEGQPVFPGVHQLVVGVDVAGVREARLYCLDSGTAVQVKAWGSPALSRLAGPAAPRSISPTARP